MRTESCVADRGAGRELLPGIGVWGGSLAIGPSMANRALDSSANAQTHPVLSELGACHIAADATDPATLGHEDATDGRILGNTAYYAPALQQMASRARRNETAIAIAISPARQFGVVAAAVAAWARRPSPSPCPGWCRPTLISRRTATRCLRAAAAHLHLFHRASPSPWLFQ